MEVEESISQKNEAESKSEDLESKPNATPDPSQEEKESRIVSGKEDEQETTSADQIGQTAPDEEPKSEPSRQSDPSETSDKISGSGAEVSESEPQMEVDSTEVKDAAEDIGYGSSQPAEDGTEHQKMPDHPGRDSDSEYSEDEGTED